MKSQKKHLLKTLIPYYYYREINVSKHKTDNTNDGRHNVQITVVV